MSYETVTVADVPPAADDPRAEFDALQSVISKLQPLGEEARRRILDSAATFLKLAGQPRQRTSTPEPEEASRSSVGYPAFSTDTSMSPKQFLLEKQPRTDVERVACLAFYLTHYRDIPSFKTLDLSKLNTEAAQPKFSNAANSVNNAVKTGYLAPSTKGTRQLSAAGEQFVRALPDRDAAKAAMNSLKPRRRAKRSKGKPKTPEA